MIAAASTPAGPAAKAATTTIPIVFVTASDPVAAGLVASLNRPGGNVTGVTGLAVELGQKQLEVLHELVPTATLIGVLINPTSPTCEQQRPGQARSRCKYEPAGRQRYLISTSSQVAPNVSPVRAAVRMRNSRARAAMP